MKLRKWYLGTIVHCEGLEVMRFSEGMARRISLTRVSKLHRARLVLIPTAKYPEGWYAKGAFRRRRNRTFVFSLNERRIMPPFPHPFSPWERKSTGVRARAAIIFGRGRVESNGAIIRTFANQLGERCENYRHETLFRLSCPLGTALEETGRLRALNSCGPHREERCLESQV